MDLTIDALLDKGISPKDIAKIFGVSRDEVMERLYGKTKSKKEADRRKECIEVIMSIVGCGDVEAGAAFDAIKEMLKKPVRGRRGRPCNQGKQEAGSVNT